MAFTETFTGSNTTSPPNGNWTNHDNGIQIQTNAAAAVSGGTYCFAHYSGGAFANDQYAFCTYLADACGPIVRASGTNNCYFLDCNDSGGSTSYLWKRIAGSLTLLQNLSTTFTNGDIARIEITGNTIKAFKNGVQIGTDQASGGELTTGSAGVMCLAATASLDNWEGGDLGGGPAFVVQPNRRSGQAVKRAAEW
jgi:hypothetical protein